jgi:phenylpropionate dioxygenase-like ring-hydroxylating dioxygenase large terminal subunit
MSGLSLAANPVDFDRRTVSPDVYVDPGLYRAEQDRIFARSWLYVGHVSQIPRPGDYVQASMGEESVIVWRAEGDAIGVFLNSCVHRGMPLCREDGGRAKKMVCPYHGWSYDLKGRLVAIPHFAKTYSGVMKKDEWGLIRVPRVETYRGLIFACFDPDVVPLEDYLGDMRWYLDSVFNRTAAGVRVLPGAHRWIVDANWKFGAENATGDNAHAQVAHSSMMSLFEVAGANNSATKDIDLQSRIANGHGWLSLADPASRKAPVVAAHLDKVREEAADRLSPAQVEQIGNFFVGTVFPNFSLLYAGCTTIRVWQPLSYNKMQVWSWTLAEADASEEVIAAERRRMTTTFSSSGMVEQDDAAVWAACQQSLEAGTMRRRFPLNYQQGTAPELSFADPSRPGVMGEAPTEVPLLGFYERWCADMGIGG